MMRLSEFRFDGTNSASNAAAVRCLIVTVGLAFFAVGCGKPVSYVTGQVTMDDKPLPGGGIAFHPVDRGPVAYGTIDSEGHYTLDVGDGNGLPPGEYIVTVVGMGPLPPLLADGTQMPGKILTPTRYGDRELSDLKASIKPGRNEVNLSLKIPDRDEQRELNRTPPRK